MAGMKKYIKNYRVIGDFEDKDNLIKSMVSDNIQTENEFVYCNRGHITISRYDDNHLRIDVVGVKRFNSLIRKLKKKNFDIDIFKLSEGGWIIIKEERVPTIMTICKAKKQSQKKGVDPVGRQDKKRNYSYFKRVQERFRKRAES